MFYIRTDRHKTIAKYVITSGYFTQVLKGKRKNEMIGLFLGPISLGRVEIASPQNRYKPSRYPIEAYL